MSNNTILEDYKAELTTAKAWKAKGMTMVGKDVAGTNEDQPIDEYIAKWQAGIDAMEAGADQEQFNY